MLELAWTGSLTSAVVGEFTPWKLANVTGWGFLAPRGEPLLQHTGLCSDYGCVLANITMVKEITNKDLLYSTGNSAQYSVIRI